MNEEAEVHRHHRSSSKAHLLAKINRYRLLVFKKSWLIVLCVAAGVGVAWAVSHFGPPSYTSVGRMIVSIKLAIPEGSVYTEEMSSFLGTQAALMQSAVVVQRAHARVRAQETNLVSLPVMLKVSVVPRTSIFVLQATGDDPKYTEAFLRGCMAEYIQVKKEMRTQTSDTTVAGLTEEILKLEGEIHKADQDLVDFQSTNSVVLLQEQGNSAGNYLSALNQRLAGMKSEYDLLQALTLDQNLERRQQVGDALPNGPDSGDKSISTGGASDRPDSDYTKGKQQILLLKAEQEELSQYLRPKHPKMVSMSEEIARRERLLGIYRQQGVDQLENRKGSLRLQIENLEKDVKEWDTKTLEISRKSAEYQKLKGNSQRIQALYDRLMATMQTLDVNKEISPESVTIMEKASPAFPDRPRLSKQLLTGGLVGLGLSIALLMLLDRLDDRMNSFTELQESFDEDVLGQIPREKSHRKEELGIIQPNDDRHSFVEAFRNLRSSLLYMAEAGQRPKTILITSSVPNDGKSLTSCNLAVTMANSGSRVLLVDADLRKGGLHHRLGQLAAEPGLCEALSQGLNWEQAVQTTKVPNLFLLPRGATSHQSSEFFINKTTETFLKEAAAKYDYVLLDTAPVMAADDVTSLAPLIDGVLFVIRAEQTSARVARAALELLYQRQARILGLVFNAIRPSSADYYYYYKYKDYYRTYPTVDGKQRHSKSHSHRESRAGAPAVDA